MLRLMVADVDSPSYFVATAAVELGFFKEAGLDVELELVYGARSGPERLRDGTLHFFGGPAYAATRAFPAWLSGTCWPKRGSTSNGTTLRSFRVRPPAKTSCGADTMASTRSSGEP